tara:strand:- start:78 stop:377 length:300 start_codon:yes stop_codon:yes gene_type:complete
MESSSNAFNPLMGNPSPQPTQQLSGDRIYFEYNNTDSIKQQISNIVNGTKPTPEKAESNQVKDLINKASKTKFATGDPEFDVFMYLSLKNMVKKLMEDQ